MGLELRLYMVLSALLALWACGGREALESGISPIPDDTGLPEEESLEFMDACAAFQGVQVPGGTSYFAGNYLLTGAEVAGHEAWYILANEGWIAAGEGDCQVVWTAIGALGDPVRCTTCDASLTVSAAINREETTCPDGLWADLETWEVVYDLRLTGDGRALFFFAEHGGVVGTGAYDGARATFLSDPACVWF